VQSFGGAAWGVSDYIERLSGIGERWMREDAAIGALFHATRVVHLEKAVDCVREEVNQPAASDCSLVWPWAVATTV